MLKKLTFLFALAASLPAFTNENLEEEFQHSTTPQQETANFQPFSGTVIGSKVRMRTAPNLEAHVVRETLAGEMFGVSGEENDYYCVQPPKGMKGYIFRTFVLEGTVEGERVNIRLYPDIEAPVIGQLNTGDKVDAVISDINNKWLEIDLPNSCHFYIAKEYLEKSGPIELIAELDKKHHEATHRLSSAFLYAQSEIQKPFEQVDLDSINEKFFALVKDYEDLPDIGARAEEARSLIEEVYVQKKIAFLESKANSKPSPEISKSSLDRLAKLGIDLQVPTQEKDVQEIAEAVNTTVGLAATISDEEATDKMLLWQPLEESIYHLWAAANNAQTMDDFYSEEENDAEILTGFIELYNRPVKNRPGDYLLKTENHPVAYLYSTRVNLEKFVGKKATVKVAPRPNNNFAFPAFFVLSVE